MLPTACRVDEVLKFLKKKLGIILVNVKEVHLLFIV